MDPENKDNDLYARWLEGKLSEEERAFLSNSGDEDTLKRIVESVDSWSLPPVKKGPPQQKESRPSARIVPLYRLRIAVAVAASFALIIASYWLFKPANELPSVMLSCTPGQMKGFVLPDSTVVILSGNSQVTFHPNDFLSDRTLHVIGEVSFNVRKKGPFCSNFEGGRIRVLGTRFTVLSKDDFSSVKCYEGKVQVELGAEKFLLEKGKAVRKNGLSAAQNYEIPGSDVFEVRDEERFVNAPLREVCASLEAFYNVGFTAQDVDLNRNFTGVYRKTNLDTALFMVFEPMGIKYRQENNKVILNNK